MARILIVEDEDIIRSALRKVLVRQQFDVVETASVREALEQDPSTFDLVISDLRLPDASGTDIISQAGDTPVIIMTSYASMRSAVDAMKLGAADYIAKPFDHDEMVATIKRTLANSPAGQRPPTAKSHEAVGQPAGILGQSPPMLSLYDKIAKVAPTDATVLIIGETGTGKERVAAAIHAASPRHAKPLISVNCAAIPETLIEAELFGHEKGAFAGADSDRDGLVVAADGGSLFLDEIGELPLEAQARLLRVLQESEIRPLGATRARKVNVRLLAATQRDLKQLCAEGKFREDLFFRINVVAIELPPLRHRGDDILLLAHHFIEAQCRKLGKPALTLSPLARSALQGYAWPGNVRELENAIQRAVILCDDPTTLNDTHLGLPGAQPLAVTGTFAAIAAEGEASDSSLDDYFKRFVLEHQDTLSETELARKLGVSRKCLWERRHRLGIPRPPGRRSNR